MREAAECLEREGSGADEVLRYRPEEMVAQVDVEIAHASSIASLGQAMNRVKARRELARAGFGFLIVRVRRRARAVLRPLPDRGADHPAGR